MRSHCLMRYAYAATGAPSTTPDRYYACVSVYWKARRGSRSYSSAWACGEPEVSQPYVLDPALQHMRLRMVLRDGYRTPLRLDLAIQGKGALHAPPPSMGQRTYAPVVTQWGSRRAVATGTVSAPALGTRRVAKHRARAGLLARGFDVYRWSSRYPHHRHPS